MATKNTTPYWIRLVTKILIPFSFFFIVAFDATWIAGVMLIVTLFYYFLVWKKIGETKE